jgi:predicted lipoprotein
VKHVIVSPHRSITAAAAALFLFSCGSSGGTEPDDAGSEPTPSTELLRDAASCVTTHVSDVSSAVARLQTAVDAVAADPSVTNLDAARTAWLEVQSTWQVLEFMQVGPLATASNTGGQDLRDEIYSWPLSSRCFVEQTIVNGNFDVDTLRRGAVNSRGLDAIEYLLFYEGTENGCPSTNVINSSGSWAALDPTERTSRRLTYAANAMALVSERTAELVTAWGNESGGFAQTLATAGAAGSPYPRDVAAINDLSNALFYMEKQLRDAKVGRPLGIWECTLADCTILVEAPYARMGLEHIRRNLRGASFLIRGCGEAGAGTGFEELLVSVGASDLATRLVTALDAAIAAADAVEGDDLAAAIGADRAGVTTLHDRLKDLTDLLKFEMVVVLGLDLPPSVAGDND